MPGPYTPPHPRRTQVVRSRRGPSAPRWRGWWLVPAVGLVPLLAAILATQGAFSPAAKAPSPIAAAPTQSVAAPPATVAAVATPQATSAPPSSAGAPTPAAASTSAAGAPTAAPTSTSAVASGQPAGTASPTTVTGSSSSSGTTNASHSTPYVAYHVQPGDTVRFIARTYGVSPASIIQASGLANPDQLRVGQLLTIPAQPGWLYRVQPGETLDQIAARTGVATDRIASASGLSIASVGPGDVLLIPDQTAAGQSK